jgi:hypothetical protein
MNSIWQQLLTSIILLVFGAIPQVATARDRPEKPLPVEGWVAEGITVTIVKTGGVVQPKFTFRAVRNGKEEWNAIIMTTYCFGNEVLTGYSAVPLNGADTSDTRQVNWGVDVLTNLQSRGGDPKEFIKNDGSIVVTIVLQPGTPQDPKGKNGVPVPIVSVGFKVAADGQWRSKPITGE